MRAKIAAIRFVQTRNERLHLDEFHMYLQWARGHADRPTGHVYITFGFSGSGKSYWAAQLIGELPAIRIRSDVMRKSLQELRPGTRTASAPNAGIYSHDHSLQLYERMSKLARTLAVQGEVVIIDAACLHRQQRMLLQRQFDDAGVDYSYLVFEAPPELLKQRIRQRAATGSDPSEADESILDLQMRQTEPLETSTRAHYFDTTTLELTHLLSVLQH